MRSRCKNMNKRMRSKRKIGSSSVLVIMIMLLLITFGVLAMMSSYSNLKIARKHAQWTREFYSLESLAEKDLSLVKGALLSAGEEVRELLRDNPNLTEEMSYAEFLRSFHKAVESNTHLMEIVTLNFDEADLNVEIKENWVPEIVFISEDTVSGRKLLVKLVLDRVAHIAMDKSYEVAEWREIPVDFDYDDALNFSDPGGN